MNPADLYLSIAFLKQCNLACGYCHPFGESKMTHGRNMDFGEMQQVLSASHAAGFRVYRFTGGECTIVPWFPDAVRHAMELDPSVRVNVCTNGTTLGDFIDLFSQHRDRIGVRVSLDSLDASKRAVGLDKTLTNDLLEHLTALKHRGVYVRLNVVVTRFNVDELPEIIDLGVALGIDVKLLDLYVQDEYIATHGKAGTRAPGDPTLYWESAYCDLGTLVPYLEERSTARCAIYNRDGGAGIPMSSYSIEGIEVILKDSLRGAFFSRSVCSDGCPYFGRECQEGVYTPHVSSNMVLHVNGCKNQAYRWNLRGAGFAEQVRQFRAIVETFFEDLMHVPEPPRALMRRRHRRRDASPSPLEAADVIEAREPAAR